MSKICETRCDDNHLGHFFYNYMRKISNEICQIDAATGEEETCASVLSRSIRMAQCFGRLGLAPGDPIAIAGRNHLNVHIPFYAAMMSGLPVAGIDPNLKKSEIKHMLQIMKPKIAFCEYPFLEEYQQAVQELDINMMIVSFGGGKLSFEKLVETYQDLPAEEDFRVATFNTDEVFCWLCSTSGSTGKPKIVALRHSQILLDNYFKMDKPKNGVRRTALSLSTLHWISGCFNALLMPVYYIKVQTSAPVTTEHVIDIINKYKPAATMTTPTLFAPILHHEKHCELTCFDMIKLAGSKIHIDLLKNLRTRLHKDAVIHQGYGQTEVGSTIMNTRTDEPYGNMGAIESKFEGKLVDPKTGRDILEPNVVGKLLIKGPTMACYYNDPKSTKEAFNDDGYLMTGDLFYKDENGLFYFVERLKMVLKYRNYQVVPPDVEEVILTHEGVADVCVTGVPHPDDGEHVVACVVRQQGSQVTAQEIKDLVAEHLSDSKRLRGGVVFLDALPTTSNGKLARMEVKKFVLTAHRE